jgi:hypothetical protein
MQRAFRRCKATKERSAALLRKFWIKCAPPSLPYALALA